MFWVPAEARWSHLQAKAKSPEIGIIIDEAMDAIEKVPSNDKLKGALPKGYARPALNKVMLGELIDLFSNIGMHDEFDKARDLFGRVYEYCLSSFAANEGKRGGEFLTPRSVVRTLVDMLEPYKGRVYDPCCGTGGMFVQSEKFIDEHGGRINDIAVYGQEINHTTYRLAKMNLAVQGIDAEIEWNNEGSFHRDAFPDLKADFILANPPFNISDWGGEHVRDDVRWKFGVPPVGNANFAWLQHIIHHLAPRGTAGVVLANGSMSSQQSGEGEIRKAMIEGDVVDCMVALPGQLFYSTQIPACLWFLARNKSANGHRDRRGEFLFIDARKLGFMIDRVRREFSPEDIARITSAYHRWRAKPATLKKQKLAPYADEPGFCASVSARQGARARPRADAGPLCRRGRCGGRRRAVRGEVRGVAGEAGGAVRGGAEVGEADLAHIGRGRSMTDLPIEVPTGRSARLVIARRLVRLAMPSQPRQDDLDATCSSSQDIRWAYSDGITRYVSRRRIWIGIASELEPGTTMLTFPAYEC